MINMAVEGKEAVYEGDSGGEEEEAAAAAAREAEERGRFNEELQALHMRVSESRCPLSGEALAVLHRALLSLDDPPSTHRHNPFLSPLLHHLRSLRTLIPPPHQVEVGSTSSVVTGALNYLEQLRKEIQHLKEAMQKISGVSPKDYMGSVKVERIGNAKLHISVHCKKRDGLLSNLMLTLETLGLIIDQMDIPHNDLFIVDAITTQVGEAYIDEDSVKEAVWRIICEDI